MVVMELGIQQIFGASGSYYSAEIGLQLGASASKILDRGLWMVTLSGNDKVQYTPDAGITFRDVILVGLGGVVFADGFNVRIFNTGVADTGAVKTFLVQIKAVPGI